MRYDDEEDREARNRQLKAQESQRSHQQQKDKEVVKPKTKAKLSNPLKNVIDIETLSDQEKEPTLYKLNVEFFWEGEKIAFNTEIQKRELGGEHPQLYTMSATEDRKAREHTTSLGHISCHRVSLVATPSYGSLAATEQKHFSIPKTDGGEYRRVIETILQELLD